MDNYTEILVGLIFLLVPIYLWITNWGNFGVASVLFLKGGLVWFVVGIGMVLLLIGLNGLELMR